MNRDGLGKIKRAELQARVAILEQTISEQAARVRFIRQKGWDARTADRRLELLVNSHERYLKTLSHLSSERPGESRTPGDTTHSPSPTA